MPFKKGQAALDFLMTYGWAIALVVIIAAVLFALGIFDTSNFVGNRASGFSGVEVSNWRLDTSGVLTLQLQNQVGKTVNLTSVNATVSGLSGGNTTNTQLQVGGTSGTITVTGLPSGLASGTGYTAAVSITYLDSATSFQYVSAGTLTGKIA